MNLTLRSCCLLGLAAGIFAPARAEDGLKLIETATVFSMQGAGFAGFVEPGAIGLSQVLKSPKAADLLVEAFQHSTPAGKCFALVGLHWAAPKRFASCAEDFRQVPVPKVSTANGCLFDTEPGTDILAQIESGQYDRNAQDDLSSIVATSPADLPRLMPIQDLPEGCRRTADTAVSGLRNEGLDPAEYRISIRPGGSGVVTVILWNDATIAQDSAIRGDSSGKSRTFLVSAATARIEREIRWR